MRYIINLVLTIFALVVMVACNPATAEETMINLTHLKELVVQPTLEKMETAFPGAANPAAVNLLVGIAAHEPTIGGVTQLKQVGGGPALGIYQIEPRTHEDVYVNYLEDPRFTDKLALMLDWCPQDDFDDQAIMFDLRYQTAIARVIIYRADFSDHGIDGWPDPDDVEGQARIWKTLWNTELGAGTVEQFVDHFPPEILTSGNTL